MVCAIQIDVLTFFLPFHRPDARCGAVHWRQSTEAVYCLEHYCLLLLHACYLRRHLESGEGFVSLSIMQCVCVCVCLPSHDCTPH